MSRENGRLLEFRQRPAYPAAGEPEETRRWFRAEREYLRRAEARIVQRIRTRKVG